MRNRQELILMQAPTIYKLIFKKNSIGEFDSLERCREGCSGQERDLRVSALGGDKALAGDEQEDKLLPQAA